MKAPQPFQQWEVDKLFAVEIQSNVEEQVHVAGNFSKAENTADIIEVGSKAENSKAENTMIFFKWKSLQTLTAL